MTKLQRVGFYRQMPHGEPTDPDITAASADVAGPDGEALASYLDAGALGPRSPLRPGRLRADEGPVPRGLDAQYGAVREMRAGRPVLTVPTVPAVQGRAATKLRADGCTSAGEPELASGQRLGGRPWAVTG